MKNKCLVILLSVCFLGLTLWNLFGEKPEYSESERRKLASAPELTMESAVIDLDTLLIHKSRKLLKKLFRLVDLAEYHIDFSEPAETVEGDDSVFAEFDNDSSASDTQALPSSLSLASCLLL